MSTCCLWLLWVIVWFEFLRKPSNEDAAAPPCQIHPHIYSWACGIQVAPFNTHCSVETDAFSDLSISSVTHSPKETSCYKLHGLKLLWWEITDDGGDRRFGRDCEVWGTEAPSDDKWDWNESVCAALTCVPWQRWRDRFDKPPPLHTSWLQYILLWSDRLDLWTMINKHTHKLTHFPPLASVSMPGLHTSTINHVHYVIIQLNVVSIKCHKIVKRAIYNFLEPRVGS